MIFTNWYAYDLQSNINQTNRRYILPEV